MSINEISKLLDKHSMIQKNTSKLQKLPLERKIEYSRRLNEVVKSKIQASRGEKNKK